MSGMGVKIMKEVEEICKCGINYQTWMDYDMECVGDGLHVWENE
jgi:hypothetical protein